MLQNRMPQESLILKKNSVRISLAFAPQGFNQEDMLGLIACGHSFGSVQNTAFPDIIPPSTDPHDTSGNVHFDSTFDHFDNKMLVCSFPLMSFGSLTFALV